MTIARTLIVTAFAATVVWLTVGPEPAHAHQWNTARTSAYGPGLFGNRTACGQTLRSTTIGVAHRSLPCGTRLTFRRGSRIVHASVIDRGPYVSGRTFDLTEATVRRLGVSSCSSWGVRNVAWHRGWTYSPHRV